MPVKLVCKPRSSGRTAPPRVRLIHTAHEPALPAPKSKRLKLVLPKKEAQDGQRTKVKLVLKRSGGSTPDGPQNRMQKVWTKVSTAADSGGRTHAELFMRLPSPNELPSYYAVIRNPIDMETISRNLNGGRYASWESFCGDMQLMLDNARLFNMEGSEIYNDAQALQHVFRKSLRRYSGVKQATASASAAAAPSEAAHQPGAGVVPDSCDICCDGCDEWHTTAGVGMSVASAQAMTSWFCPECAVRQQPYPPRCEAAHGRLPPNLVMVSPAPIPVYYTGPSLPQLPDDMLVSTLLPLDLKSMLAVTAVSQSWRAIAQRDWVWQTVCTARLPGFVAPRRARKSWMKLFIEAYTARHSKIAENTQKLFMKSDKVFRSKTDNVAALRKLLVEHGVPADIRIDTHGGATWEFNALVNLAARFGRMRCVRELVENWGASLEIKDEGGFTPLLEAAFHGVDLMVKYCLSKGADTSVLGVSLGPKTEGVRSKNGPFTAFEWAVRRRHVKCAELIKFEMDRPWRDAAKTADHVAVTLENIILVIEKQDRKLERQDSRVGREVAEAIQKLVRDVEKQVRNDQRLESEKERVAQAKERALASQERAAQKSEKAIASVVERLVCTLERESAAAMAAESVVQSKHAACQRVAAFAIERIVKTLEVREAREAKEQANLVAREAKNQTAVASVVAKLVNNVEKCVLREDAAHRLRERLQLQRQRQSMRPMMSVQCPPGAAAGSTVRITHPSGQKQDAIVPAGITEGMSFQLQAATESSPVRRRGTGDSKVIRQAVDRIIRKLETQEVRDQASVASVVAKLVNNVEKRVLKEEAACRLREKLRLQRQQTAQARKQKPANAKKRKLSPGRTVVTTRRENSQEAGDGGGGGGGAAAFVPAAIARGVANSPPAFSRPVATMSASGGARTNAKCEDCQLTSKNYGLPDSGARWKARWCGKCAKKYGGVLRATAAKLQQQEALDLQVVEGVVRQLIRCTEQEPADAGRRAGAGRIRKASSRFLQQFSC